MKSKALIEKRKSITHKRENTQSLSLYNKNNLLLYNKKVESWLLRDTLLKL